MVFDSHVTQLRSLPDQVQSWVKQLVQQNELFSFSGLCNVLLVALAREPADGRSRYTIRLAHGAAAADGDGCDDDEGCTVAAFGATVGGILNYGQRLHHARLGLCRNPVPQGRRRFNRLTSPWVDKSLVVIVESVALMFPQTSRRPPSVRHICQLEKGFRPPPPVALSTTRHCPPGVAQESARRRSPRRSQCALPFQP